VRAYLDEGEGDQCYPQNHVEGCSNSSQLHARQGGPIGLLKPDIVQADDGCMENKFEVNNST